MINWFLLSLVAPVLWSIINHIDKYILSKYEKGRGVGALLLFSSLFSVIVLPFIGLIYRSKIFSISVADSLILVFAGLLGATAFYFYLKAMEVDEASVVVPLFQFDPIFGYILGFIFLNELLTRNQLLASILIIIGIISISVEIDEDNNYKFKKRVFFLVIVSSFFFALSGVLFKKLALMDSFWVSIFWQYVGITIFGILVLAFYKKFRDDFITMLSGPNLRFLSANIVSEILYVVGALANNFALLIAPVALVFVVNSYQPLFVFIAGIIFTIFTPGFVTEKITRRHLLHKLFSIVVILIGSYLLYYS